MIYAVIFLATENKIRRNGDQSRKKKNKDTTMIKNKRTQKKKKQGQTKNQRNSQLM